MPNFPDIPGKGLITGMTKRTQVAVGATAAGALAVGGFVVKRVLGHGNEGDGESVASADPIAETPTAPPGAEEKPVPKPAKPKAAKPKPPKGKADSADAGPKPKADPRAGKAKPVKPKAPPKRKAGAKPPRTTGTDAPPKPKAGPGRQTGGRDPHHALNNPVGEPDLTEYPDPYDTREDPRDPVDPDAPFGEEPRPQTGAESTSEPPPSQDPELENGGKPPRRDNLDD